MEFKKEKIKIINFLVSVESAREKEKSRNYKGRPASYRLRGWGPQGEVVPILLWGSGVGYEVSGVRNLGGWGWEERAGTGTWEKDTCKKGGGWGVVVVLPGLGGHGGFLGFWKADCALHGMIGMVSHTLRGTAGPLRLISLILASGPLHTYQVQPSISNQFSIYN